MDEDFYPQGGDEKAAPDEGGGSADAGRKPAKRETTLVPKTMFEGKDVKPGDQFYFEVEHVYENEVEVSYGHDEKKEKPEEEEGHEEAFDRSMAGGGEAGMSMMGGGGGNPGGMGGGGGGGGY